MRLLCQNACSAAAREPQSSPQAELAGSIQASCAEACGYKCDVVDPWVIWLKTRAMAAAGSLRSRPLRRHAQASGAVVQHE
eukprot:s6170_g7.t1